MNDHTGLPDWLSGDIDALASSDVFGDPQATAALLSASRDEMFGAYSIFESHMRNGGYLIGVIFLAAGALTSLALDQSSSEARSQTLIVGAAALLVLVVPVSILLIRATTQVYRLYASSVVYSSELHQAAGLATHPWFDFVFSYPAPEAETSGLRSGLLSRVAGPSPTHRTRLMDSWVTDSAGVLSSFLMLLALVDVISVAGAVGLLLQGL